MSVPSNAPVRVQSELSEVEQHILNTLQQIRFGTLEVVIHDSRIVQIERSEKVRFDVKGRPLQDSLS